MPEAPNLLFTNAGMNQFVPHFFPFLGQQKAAVEAAAGAWPTRRNAFAPGGKHTTISKDVGLDTYHHHFFSRCWAIGVSVIISRRKRSNGRGNLVVERLETSRRSGLLRHRLQAPGRTSLRSSTRKRTIIGNDYFAEGRSRSRHSHRKWKQEKIISG